MTRQVKYLVGIIAVSLIILSPSPVLAQNFSVSPAEVKIDDLFPGEEAEFQLTIHNKDNIRHNFTLTAHTPEKLQRRQGRAEFPDNSWISFSPQQVKVQAGSKVEIKVLVDIPSSPKWAGKDWEVWLEVTPESSNLLTVEVYVRLLISTGGGTGSSFNIWLISGTVAVMSLLGYSIYYFRRKTR